MKKLMVVFAALLAFTVQANAMGYEQARQQALFLTDKMAYELNLTDAQYEAAYEINLDYLMGVNSVDDLYGVYWTRRNTDLSYILWDWQYEAYLAANYFYRPLYWDAGYWHFGIYARYPYRDYFFFGRPHFYMTYRGGHSWHHNGGHSWYHGRDWGHSTARRGIGGMRDRFDKGDFGRGGKIDGRGGNGPGRGGNNGGPGMGNNRGNGGRDGNGAGMGNGRGNGGSGFGGSAAGRGNGTNRGNGTGSGFGGNGSNRGAGSINGNRSNFEAGSGTRVENRNQSVGAGNRQNATGTRESSTRRSMGTVPTSPSNSRVSGSSRNSSTFSPSRSSSGSTMSRSSNYSPSRSSVGSSSSSSRSSMGSSSRSYSSPSRSMGSSSSRSSMGSSSRSSSGGSHSGGFGGGGSRSGGGHGGGHGGSHGGGRH